MMVITYYPETKQHNEILITFNLYIQGFRKGRRRGTLHSQLACSLWENSNDSHWPSRPNMNPFSEVTRNDDALKKITLSPSLALHLYIILISSMASDVLLTLSSLVPGSISIVERYSSG